MGGKAACALNVLALDCALGNEVAREVLRGGADAVLEAGATIVGGHSIDDPEPKYGLAVFGLVDPARIVRNEGAIPGDVLYLTKPLGVGLLSAAYKIGEVDLEAFAPAIASMKELNRAGGVAMLEADVHAATDVTGFGLAGHLHEMLEPSGVGAVLDWDAMPLFEGAWDLSCAYCRPNRTFSIMDYAAPFVEQETSTTRSSTTAWRSCATPDLRRTPLRHPARARGKTSSAPSNGKRAATRRESAASSKTRRT